MDLVDHVRGDGRHQPADRDQHLMQRVLASQLVSRLSVIPQSASAAANIPVGEIVDDEVLQFPARLVEVPTDELVVEGGTHGIEPREQPPVEWSA